jgi:hypothetical protein
MLKLTDEEKQRTDNCTFAIGGVSCSADSFVAAESLVLRMNIWCKNPAIRKSAKRYVPLFGDRANSNWTARNKQ